MIRSLSNAWLMGMAVLSNERAAFSARAKSRLEKLHDEELGQTPTEYLMIAGLMAAVIVVAFVTLYWDTVKGAASTWTATVRDAITAGERSGSKPDITK